MITRFRVEGEHNTQDDVVTELSLAASRIIKALDQWEGKWECTQDVVHMTDTGYKGRMVLKFEPDLGEEDEDEAEG